MKVIHKTLEENETGYEPTIVSRQRTAEAIAQAIALRFSFRLRENSMSRTRYAPKN